MKPSKHVPQNLRKEMDRLFASLKLFDEKITEINGKYEQETKSITELYSAMLAPIEDEHKAHSKALKSLIKANSDKLFQHPDAGSYGIVEDRVYTALGVALRQVGEKLKTTRETLALCEKRGFVEAVKIAKSLDRAKLADWPADKLAMVSAEKRAFVDYGFELVKGGDVKLEVRS